MGKVPELQLKMALSALEQRFMKGVRITSVLEIILGVCVFLGILFRSGAVYFIAYSTFGLLLFASGILGIIASGEWKSGIMAPSRLRTLAALNTALGLVGVIIAASCVILIILVFAGVCTGTCAQRIGAPTCPQPAIWTIARTPMLMNGGWAGLMGVTCLTAGRKMRQWVAAMLANQAASTQSQGLLEARAPCPAYEEVKEKAENVA